jgi:hypothetical protein
MNKDKFVAQQLTVSTETASALSFLNEETMYDDDQVGIALSHLNKCTAFAALYAAKLQRLMEYVA